MRSRDFVFWLQGFFEIQDASSNRTSGELTEGQVNSIKKHLALVFKHDIDPSMGDKPHQNELNQIHGVTVPNMPGSGHGGTSVVPGRNDISLRC